MMDIKELRVGNWAIDNEGRKTRVNNRINDLLAQNLNPILIDKDIYDKLMLNSCFNIELDKDLNTNKFLELDISFNGDLLLLSVAGKNTIGFFRIKYLHQLQNLFYDLTEKELEIELK